MTYVFIKGEYLETGIEGETAYEHEDSHLQVKKRGLEQIFSSLPVGATSPALISGFWLPEL